MLVFKNGREVQSQQIEMDGVEEALYVLPVSEIALLDSLLDIKSKILQGIDPDDYNSKYEFHDGYDMLYINIPPELQDTDNFRFLGAYITDNCVICIYEEWKEQPYLIEIVRNDVERGMSVRKVILALVDAILRNDFKVLGKIEDNIDVMEDSVTDSHIESKVREISQLRRELLPLKRFYEHLMDAMEDLEENKNGVFPEQELKYANLIYSRIDRLYKTVLNLRDYITQVREAYQAQMDIALNRTMKTFTVIAAIFLPLTLLAGWYGMNLQMPEASWKYGYLFVAGIAIFIVAVCIVYFKRKKWF